MEFISALLDGLSGGGTYAMIALGYTMVYGIAKMLNFAHGDIIMVGAYMVSFIVLDLTLNVFLGVLAAILFCVVVGITVERFAYKPLRGASPLAVLITAIGVSYLLQSLAQMYAGSASYPVMSLMIFETLSIGSLVIRYDTLITLAVAAVIMISLTIFIKKTKTGRAMVAVSEDKDAARLMGINVNYIIMITFAIGSALAAVAGVFMLMKGWSVSPTLGAIPGIKAFTAAVIGGIGSVPGAMLGGIILGIIEALCSGVAALSFLSPFVDAIEFSILIVILLVRPAGLLGKKRREKV